MTWVKLYHTDEVVVELPSMPSSASKDELREAALRLVDVGLYHWSTVDGGMEVDEEYLPYMNEA